MKPATQPVTHTPGPWKVHKYLDGRTPSSKSPQKLPSHIVPASHAERPIGFSVHDAEDLTRFAQSICSFSIGYRHRSDEEIWANARLISSAPELLEALTLVNSLLDKADDEEISEEVRAQVEGKVRAAIAKATGAEGTQGEQR